MLNKLLIIFCTVLYVLPVHSQDWKRIVSNPALLHGEGWGVTLSEADNNALNDLLSKITIQITNTTHQTDKETVAGDSLTTESSFESIISTYSNTTLTNTSRVIVKNEPDAHVVRWIRRSDVSRIFEARKFKANEYVELAEKALLNRKIDVALKDYYWAWILVKSLQYPNEATYTNGNGERYLLCSWLPQKINEILSDLTVLVTHKDGLNVELAFNYRGMPVSSIDYTYFDGRDWSNIYSAKDGTGILELAPGNVSEKYSIKIEYEYRGEAHIDKDLEDVFTITRPKAWKNAYLVAESASGRRHSPAQSATAQHTSLTTDSGGSMVMSSGKNKEYRHAMKTVVHSLKTSNPSPVRSLCTSEGFTIYQRLMQYGNPALVGNPLMEFYTEGKKVVARGIRCAFSFPNGYRKSFVENLIFTFNADHLIENITFGLNQEAQNDILNKGVWTPTARMAIMQFLENYQTAYALKRLDYIETIFDDDAVIIVGRVARVMEPDQHYSDNLSMNASEVITYNRYDKKSYLERLKESFASKEYINLRLADNEVRKLGKGGEVYAIQISQEYYSSNYGDKGYLFLIVDINNPEQPLIKVRTWQPEKDPNFGIYGPEDFQ